MGLDEIAHPADHFFRGIFQDIMAAVFEAVNHGMGPPLAPLREEMIVENKILRRTYCM